jgi:uncharacterized protein (TIGR02444 family)
MAEDEIKPGETGSPFWRFSLDFYARPGVAEACLALQDRCGADINLLLFLLWMALSRRSFSPEAVRAFDKRIGDWRKTVVIPLRTLRRNLKQGSALVAPAEAEAFRAQVKALELEAERSQQEAMAALAASAADGMAESIDAAARQNIAAYQTVSSRDFPADLVAVLLAALRNIDAGAFADNSASPPPR